MDYSRIQTAQAELKNLHRRCEALRANLSNSPVLLDQLSDIERRLARLSNDVEKGHGSNMTTGSAMALRDQRLRMETLNTAGNGSASAASIILTDC